MQVTLGGYHAWKTRKPSARSEESAALSARIVPLFDERNGTYGPTRMQQHLRKEGIEVGRNRVAGLMHAQGLSARVPKKHIQTTDSNHNKRIAPNLVERRFDVDKPNALWLVEISDIRTTQGFLYIAAVLDAFSRRIVGYCIDDHIRTELCEEALRMAIRTRQPGVGLLHHSDRGSQYASDDYQEILTAHSLVCSMSQKGDCWDNAMMESFFGRSKNEHLYLLPVRNKEQTKEGIRRWVELWCSHKLVHTASDGSFPM